MITVLSYFVCLCWCLTSQSTIFQSCRDEATASWVSPVLFMECICLCSRTQGPIFWKSVWPGKTEKRLNFRDVWNNEKKYCCFCVCVFFFCSLKLKSIHVLKIPCTQLPWTPPKTFSSICSVYARARTDIHLPSRKHLRTKVTPDFNPTYTGSKNEGNMGLVLKR